MINHKYTLSMKDENGNWNIICTSGNKEYLDTIAKQLEDDGEDTSVEAILDQDITV